MSRFRRLILVWGMLILCTAAGCGKRGAPAVPPPKVPSQVLSLTAQLRCAAVELRFTPPETYLDGRPLQEVKRFVVMRKIIPPEVDANATIVTVATDWEPVAYLPPRGDVGYSPEPYFYEDTGKRFETTEGDDLRELAPPQNEDGETLAGTYLLPGHRYEYQVFTMDGRRRLATESPTVSVDYTVLGAAPEGITTKSQESGMLLAWEPVSRTCTGTALDGDPIYQVYRVLHRDPTTDGEGIRIGDTPETRFLDIEARDNQRLSYYLRSVVDGQPGPPSETVTVTYMDLFAPQPPRSVNHAVEDGTVTLFWETAGEPDLAGTIIERSEDGQVWEPMTLEPVVANRYTDRTVEQGVTYRYRLRTVDTSLQENRSAPSDEIRIVVDGR